MCLSVTDRPRYTRNKQIRVSVRVRPHYNVPVPYFAFFILCESQMTSHWSLWVMRVFFPLTSNQVEIENREMHHCDNSLSLQIDWYAAWHPKHNPGPEGIWHDVALGINLEFDTKQKVCHSTPLDERNTRCLIFVLATTFGRVMTQQPNPDFWVVDLASEVIGWPGA